MTTSNVINLNEQQLDQMFEEARNQAKSDMKESDQLCSSLCELNQLLQLLDQNNLMDTAANLTSSIDVISSGLVNALSQVKSELQHLHLIRLKNEWDQNHVEQSG